MPTDRKTELDALCPSYGDGWMALFNTTPYTWRLARARFLRRHTRAELAKTGIRYADLMAAWDEGTGEPRGLRLAFLKELVKASDARGARLRRKEAKHTR